MFVKGGFCLLFCTSLEYNNSIINNCFLTVFSKMAMKKFYYEFWLPFTFNKRRILILAIASYIALC